MVRHQVPVFVEFSVVQVVRERARREQFLLISVCCRVLQADFAHRSVVQFFEVFLEDDLARKDLFSFLAALDDTPQSVNVLAKFSNLVVCIVDAVLPVIYTYIIMWIYGNIDRPEVYGRVGHDDAVEGFLALLQTYVADCTLVVVGLPPQFDRADVADVHVVAPAHAVVLFLFAA